MVATISGKFNTYPEPLPIGPGRVATGRVRAAPPMSKSSIGGMPTMTKSALGKTVFNSGKMFSSPGQLGEKIKKTFLTPTPLSRIFAEDEPDANAILPEPLSVKKTISYQFDSALETPTERLNFGVRSNHL